MPPPWCLAELLLIVAPEIVVAVKTRNAPPLISAILLLKVPPVIETLFGLIAKAPPRPPKLVAVRAWFPVKVELFIVSEVGLVEFVKATIAPPPSLPQLVQPPVANPAMLLVTVKFVKL